MPETLVRTTESSSQYADERTVRLEPLHLAELVEQTGRVVRAVSPERLTALVAAAASARAMLGRPVVDPLDAIVDLPEVAAGEPSPVVRVPGTPNGWLSVWEVTPDGTVRSAVAVFQPDAGLVRPDVAVTAWDRCAAGIIIADHQTPSPQDWSRIIDDGVEHAYQAVARIVGETGVTLPDARLRLLVRVSS